MNPYFLGDLVEKSPPPFLKNTHGLFWYYTFGIGNAVHALAIVKIGSIKV